MSQDPLEQDPCCQENRRQDRVAHLARQLGAVISRRVGLAVGLWGEPGIGKTHAALEVLGRVPCRHLTLHATVGVVNLAQALPCPKTLPDWARSQLERLGRGEVLAPNALAHTLVHTLAASAPFVLHLEDLHEADPERLELVKALARAVVGTRGVGLLVTSRTELPPPFLGRCLEPLSSEEMAALIAQELKGGVPPDGLGWVYARTGGNPLFVLEFARYLRRQGFLWSDGERWHWREPPKDFVPVTVEALVLELVSSAASTPQARVVLEARAILPGALDPATLEAVWAEVAGLESEGFASARHTLERGGVLSAGEFAHPLFGEVMAGSLTEERRRIYAQRAVALLERTAPEWAASLLDWAHLGRAETLEFFRRTIGQAQQEGRTARAAQLLRLAAEGSEGPERVEFALEGARLLQPSGLYGQIVQLARLALGVQPQSREALHQLASALAALGQVDEVMALLAELPEAERNEVEWVQVLFRAQVQCVRVRDALETWREHPELAMHPRNVVSAASLHANRSDFATAERLLTQAFALEDIKVKERASMLSMRAFIWSEQGRLKDAELLHQECLLLLEQEGDALRLASHYYERAFNLYRLERMGDAIASLERAIKGYNQVGMPQYSANARAVLGAILTRAAHFERAEAALLESLQVLRVGAVTHSLVNTEWELGSLYLEWQPQHGAVLAKKFAQDAVLHSRQLENPRCLMSSLNVAARVSVWTGEPLQALALAQEACSLEQGSNEDLFACSSALALALEACGRPAEALEQWECLQQNIPDSEAALEVDLERARLLRDQDQIRALLESAHARGFGLLALRAQRALPDLPGATPHPALPSARINVLGPVTLERGGVSVPSRARKRLEILAYLLETRIAGRTEASVLELLDTLYPGESEVEARHTLKQQIYLIRSSLGAESVLSTPMGYALGVVSSDAEDFLRSGDPTLWRGVYLEHLGEGWRAGVREALTLELRTRAEALLERDPRTAARLAEVLCEMDPFETGVLRLTVRALEAAGEVGAARRAFAEGHARLLEIGVNLPQRQSEFVSGQTVA